jgi:hypothetical protein
MDLFWIYQEDIILKCLIHLLNISKIKLIRMNEEVNIFYFYFCLYLCKLMLSIMLYFFNLFIFFKKKELMTYIMKDMVQENVLRFGLQSCLPFNFE